MTDGSLFADEVMKAPAGASSSATASRPTSTGEPNFDASWFVGSKVATVATLMALTYNALRWIAAGVV